MRPLFPVTDIDNWLSDLSLQLELALVKVTKHLANIHINAAYWGTVIGENF